LLFVSAERVSHLAGVECRETPVGCRKWLNFIF